MSSPSTPRISASEAVDKAGGTVRVASLITKLRGETFTPQAVSGWKARNSIPPEYVWLVADLIGEHPSALRPDIFPSVRLEPTGDAA